METGFVSVIDTYTNMVTASIPVGNRPLVVASTPNGDLAYVTNATDNTVSVIDTSSSTVVASIPVPNFPWGVDSAGVKIHYTIESLTRPAR